MARRTGSGWQGYVKIPEKYLRYNFANEELADVWNQAALKSNLPDLDPTVIRERQLNCTNSLGTRGLRGDMHL